MMKCNNKHKWQKYALTIVSSILLLLLYSIIFSFSAQDGESSGGISLQISEKCVSIWNAITGRNWTDAVMKNLAVYFEHPLRKIAHFAEYAVMGVLVSTLWFPWIKRGRKLYFLITIWVFISAALDEIHQYFIPGRYGSFADVCLDTCGGVFGLLLCIGAVKWYGSRKRITRVP